MPADLVRIPRVPILSTGTYQLSTGEFTFTAEDLAAAAAAPATDAAVQYPRVKIDGLGESFDPAAHGGEPAFGRVENLIVDGETLYGDYLVPPGLAAVIDWAYPARSIEGVPGSIMGPTATGKTHELVITAVALLGVDLPGVSTLPDLMDVLAEFGGVAEPEQVAVMATIGASDSAFGATTTDTRGVIQAGLDQELIRRRFYDATEGGDDSVEIPEGETGWSLWIRSMRFDDDGSAFLVVESMDSGRLYRYGFNVSGNEATFSLTGEVAEQYTPVAAGARRRAPVAVWATREQSRAVMASTGGTSGMTPEQIAALAAGYGLDPDTATEADIMAAAQAAADARAAEAAASAEEGSSESGSEETEGAEERQPVAASSARTVEVSAAQWQESQDRLARAEARLAEREQRETAAHRDGLIAAAVADGRILPAERADWRSDLDAAPEVTERALARLTPNRVPLHARGVTQQAENGGTGNLEAEHDAYMARHFPQEYRKLRAQREGATV